MALPTFPYTPGFVHGEQETYAVTVTRFEDLSEQRYLESSQRGLGLVYEFTPVDSAIVAGINSFFMERGGPANPFTVVDHRTGVSYAARFADNILENVRQYGMVRSLKVAFITETLSQTIQSGTAPAESAAACIADGGGGTSGAPPDPPPTPPPTPTPQDSGGAAPSYQAGSGYAAYHVPWFGADPTASNGSKLNTNFGADRYSLYAFPWILKTPRTVTGVAAYVRATTSATVQLGIYASRSSSTVDVLPDSLVANVGSFYCTTSGVNILSTTVSLAANLYWLSLCVVAATGQADAALFKSVPAARRLDYATGLEASNFKNARTIYVNSNGGDIPATWPSNWSIIGAEYAALAVRFGD